MTKTFSKTDEQFRSHGISVSLDGCAACKDSKSMDDFHRMQITDLNAEIEKRDRTIEKLSATVLVLVDRRKVYRLVVFAVGFVAALALASNAGWLK